MTTFLAILAHLLVIAASIYGLREVAIALSCRADDGRLVFAHVREKLRGGPDGWSIRSVGWIYNKTAIESGSIMLRKDEDPAIPFTIDIDVTVAGQRLTPGYGWKRRLNRNIRRLRADKRKIDRLNALSDAMEAMMEARG